MRTGVSRRQRAWRTDTLTIAPLQVASTSISMSAHVYFNVCWCLWVFSLRGHLWGLIRLFYTSLSKSCSNTYTLTTHTPSPTSHIVWHAQCPRHIFQHVFKYTSIYKCIYVYSFNPLLFQSLKLPVDRHTEWQHRDREIGEVGGWGRDPKKCTGRD